MRSPRLTCKNECAKTGHIMTDEGVARCECLKIEINMRRLGTMFTPSIVKTTPLTNLVDEDAVLDGPLSVLRQHVGRVLIDRSENHERWVQIDAYRLIEIFLGQDEEFATQFSVTDTDLLLLMLGFGDPRNKYLPELLLQALSRRELLQKPTWIILGCALDSLSVKYSTEVHGRVARMRRVKVQ